ncbi:DEAD/DEAH box helicase [Metabacillus sediminilitoris]|uniref:DEAD-box ATP-dependent RNA helicase CshB n=1 Tax=Metabacillus sediminilitoris TaxID=2567941 RepID=A0A4S4BZB1_9BACI|nr:DEAD/DEAH box helicase [Metabacillus sediminilitoris]QGQ47294.1 DEAD/DEAH box helicase [Metabacillus sediminilitoris]THF80636.1 DEAD/DEAH box helicase [Metabacillus sediminilitoris]
MEQTKFERFSLKPFIIEAISKELRFFEPTEIQERLIPSILRGESAIGQSQTGTGKTHAYLLPLLDKIEPERKEVQVVITAPTRELATQIYNEVVKVIAFSKEEITAKCFIGGTDKQRAIEKLKTQPQIVVGTPGRINDLVKVQALIVNKVRAFVVDEADLMLDMGFIKEVDMIASQMPDNLQILVFSATIPEKLKPFLKKYLENPKFTHVAPKQATAAKIEHVLVPSRHRDKTNLVYEMLLSFNPYLAIVFTNTKKKADEVADALLEKGLKVGRIHGDLTPRDRKKMMKQINDLEFQYVVATDLAARGIDIKGVSHVINFEIPTTELDFYIHRVGRTARAGSSGIAITLFEPSDEDALNKLEALGIEFINRDFVGGEWKDIEDRKRRQKRKRVADEVDAIAKSIVQKPKKVKPGYKKKMNREIEQFKKRKRRIEKKSK